jgi:hypothetical protein
MRLHLLYVRIAAAMLGLAWVGNVLAGDFRAPDGRRLATLDETGKLRDASGGVRYILQDAHTVRDPHGVVVLRIDSSGAVRAPNGEKRGLIEPGGAVRDTSGRRIGQIDRDGTARAPNGQIVGRTRDVEQRSAALYFFFL